MTGGTVHRVTGDPHRPTELGLRPDASSIGPLGLTRRRFSRVCDGGCLVAWGLACRSKFYPMANGDDGDERVLFISSLQPPGGIVAFVER